MTNELHQVLFISYAYPPILAAETIQAMHTAIRLRENNWFPTILMATPKTVQFRQDISLSINKKLKTIQIPSFEPNLILSLLNRWGKAFLHLPDSQIGWYFSAVRTGQKLLREHLPLLDLPLNKEETKKGFDLIYSRANPFTSHLVALKLKQHTGLPWVAHFSDPWTDNPYTQITSWQIKFNLFLERKVLESADRIIFVTEETKHIVMKKYTPHLQNKVRIIPHCYDLNFFSPKVPTNHQSLITNHHLLIVHTGNLYGKRSPVSLFQCLVNLQKDIPQTRLIFVGYNEPQFKRIAFELNLSKIVEFRPPVSYQESLKLTRQADVLLLVEANFPQSPFFPSKLVDYLATGKPVLGLTPADSAATRILKETGNYAVPPDDKIKIKETVLMLHDKLQKGTLTNNPVPPEYDAGIVTAKLANVFNELIK